MQKQEENRQVYFMKLVIINISIISLFVLVSACDSNQPKKSSNNLKTELSYELESTKDTLFKLELVSNVGHSNFIDHIEFSPTGKYLASTGGGNLKIWNVEQQKVVKSIDAHKSSVTQIIFSPDENYVLTASHDGTIKIWNIYSGALVRKFTDHRRSIACAAVSSDFRYLVSGGWDKTIFLWDIESGKKIGEFEGHTARVLGLSFSPDNKKIASCGWDKVLKIWDIETGAEIQSIEVYRSNVFEVIFTENENKVVTASSKDIKVWDIKSGECDVTYNATSGFGNNIDLSKNNDILAFGNFKRIKIWDFKNTKLLKEIDLTTLEKLTLSSGNSNITFSPDASKIAIARNEIISIFNTETGVRETSLKNSLRFSLKTAFTTDNNYIINSFIDSTIRIWDIKNATQKAFFTGDNYFYSRVDMALNANVFYIATASFKGNLKILAIEDGKVEVKFEKKYSESINYCKYSYSGKYLAVSISRGIQILDGKTGEFIKKIASDTYSVKPIIFHPNGKIIAYKHADGIILYDIVEEEVILKLTDHEVSGIQAIEFSPDGKFLVLATQRDDTIVLWDINNGKKLQKFEGHNDFVFSLKFDKDQQYIFSGGRDKTIRKWDIKTGKELYRINTSNNVAAIALSNDERFIIYSGGGENVILDAVTGKKVLSMLAIPYSSDWVVYSSKRKFDGVNCSKYLHYIKGLDLYEITEDEENFTSGLLNKTLLGKETNL